MPNSKPADLTAIAPSLLAHVTGGASRVSSRSGNNDQLTAMLTQVTSSIKDLAGSKQSTGMDPMMMMMMMGGMGGGGGGQQVAAAAPAAPPPQPNINVSIRA